MTKYEGKISSFQLTFKGQLFFIVGIRMIFKTKLGNPVYFAAGCPLESHDMVVRVRLQNNKGCTLQKGDL